MRPPRWKALVDKSIAACCAAIEIYNKPVVPHREETFAILVVSAWELLLKARLIQQNKNRLDAIYQREPVLRKDGTKSKRMRVKRNRANNPVTISLACAMHRCAKLTDKPVDSACRENLKLLMDVRDNAVHFLNDDPDLARKVNEIGTASLVNYVQVIGDWFAHDLGPHRFAILPLSFEGITGAKALKPPHRTQQAKNLLDYMERASTAPRPIGEDARFAVSVRVETKIVGSRAADAIPMKLGKGADAVPVKLSEEEIRRRWPHDHRSLVAQVRKRVPGFKLTQRFHDLKKGMPDEPRFTYVRYLDPDNKKSPKKVFYSEAAVDVLVREMSKPAPVASTEAD